MLLLFAVDSFGGWLNREAGPRASTAVALVLACLLLAVDALRVWAGRTASFGVDRQTLYDWRLKGRTGVVGWGLDTGQLGQYSRGSVEQPTVMPVAYRASMSASWPVLATLCH